MVSMLIMTRFNVLNASKDNKKTTLQNLYGVIPIHCHVSTLLLHVLNGFLGQSLLHHQGLLSFIKIESNLRECDFIEERTWIVMDDTLKKGVYGMNPAKAVNSLFLPIYFALHSQKYFK